jgi:hypothetical protein
MSGQNYSAQGMGLATNQAMGAANYLSAAMALQNGGAT